MFFYNFINIIFLVCLNITFTQEEDVVLYRTPASVEGI